LARQNKGSESLKVELRNFKMAFQVRKFWRKKQASSWKWKSGKLEKSSSERKNIEKYVESHF